MDTRQQRRIAVNESAFREANEGVRRAVDEFQGNGHDYEIMCECALTECEDMFELSRAEYEHVRSNARWFAVLPEHALPGAERTVEHHGHYWIIEKLDEGGKVAEARA
jgi:hypothetical protein